MYVVIQTCNGYEKSINNLLPQFKNIINHEDIIIVVNKSSEEKVFTDLYNYIHTTDNNYELTSFARLYDYNQNFIKHNNFLFIHDTVDLGENFEEKFSAVKDFLKNKKFDWAPLSKNFQCMMGIASRDFIINKFHLYKKLPKISKQEGIHLEWGGGKYAEYSLRYLSEYSLPLGENPIEISREVSFLGSNNRRVKILFESLDIYKYFYFHTNETPHPDSL